MSNHIENLYPFESVANNSFMYIKPNEFILLGKDKQLWAQRKEIQKELGLYF